jgi:hypothetical protein
MLLIIILLILLIFGGGYGYHSWGAPGSLGLVLTIILIFVLLRLLGVV